MYLSILVPVYNVEQYLPRCLDSLLNQDLRDDVEVICVDDGSTDRSGLICDDYARKDPHVKVIHQKNGGLGNARNTSIKVARGKYFAFIDSDDYVAKDWYANIYNTLSNHECDILLFGYNLARSSHIKKSHAYRTQSCYLNRSDVLLDIADNVTLYSTLCQMVFRRELFLGIVFPEDRLMAEDFAVMPDLLLHAQSIYYLREWLYFYYIRNDSIMQTRDYAKRMTYYQQSVKRYEYLSSLGYKVSQMGIWIHALGLCCKFDKQGASDLERLCRARGRQIIRKNLVAIIMSRRCPWTIKLRFILASVGLYNFIRSVRNIVYSLSRSLWWY